MRRSVASSLAAVLFTTFFLGGLPRHAWAADEVCANTEGTLTPFLRKLTLEINQIDQDLHALNEQALLQELPKASEVRPSSDGFSKGGRLDLLSRAFVGLGLGQVTNEDGQLVLNFNPEALHLSSLGQFSPRIVVHKPTLYGALDEYIGMLDEWLQSPSRDDLEKSFGDFDDVEYALRWTPKAFEPAADLKEVASTLLDQVVPENVSDVTNKVVAAKEEIRKKLNKDSIPLAGFAMTDICGNAEAKAVLEQLVQSLREDIPAANAQLHDALEGNGFNRLADLIEGNPRLVFNGNYRQRSGAAGPDTTSLDVTYQWGQVSYRGAKAYARKAKQDVNADIDAQTVTEYFKDHPHIENAAPLFSLVGSYSETNAFKIPITGVNDPFSQDKGHKLSIKGTAATYFGGGRDRKLELTATYDDVTGDKMLQNRFVADLTWVETLSDTIAQAVGGSEFVATVIWANKPEFRGQVDKDFGLRAGLKWSLGNGTKN